MIKHLINRLIRLSVVSFYVILTSNGQDFHFSNLHENLFQLNPSIITNTTSPGINLVYRNQWPGSTDFLTYSASFILPLESFKSTVGIHAIRDDQGKGIISTTGFYLLYGYKTKITNTISISAGIDGGYNLYSVDYSSLQFENNQNAELLLGKRKNFFDFAAGIEVGYMENTWIGAGISHLSNPKISTSSSYNRKYSFSLRGHYLLSKRYNQNEIFLEPLIVSSIQNRFSEILYGTRLNYSGVIGGIYFRQDFSFNYDAILLLLGINFKNTIFIYTYDINLSGADSRFNKLAAHEVTFLYKFEYNSTRKKKGAIKCPKI